MFTPEEIKEIKATIKEAIIDCELELGGLFERYGKPDENNVCDFGKCYQELQEKFGSDNAIYECCSWEFSADDVFDHWQQTAIDYLKEEKGIEVSRRTHRTLLYALINETFDEMVN